MNARIAPPATPVDLDPDAITRYARTVIATEAAAVGALESRIGPDFVRACQLIMGCKGRVVVSGMGKSGHIGRKIAATLAATGSPAIYVHPAEAAHGDLGMLVAGDVLLVISNSGNTPELRTFIKYARSIAVPVIGIASRRESFVMKMADICVGMPAAREACPANIAPTTSTALQLALGDAIAMAVMDMRGVSRDGLRLLHPGGSIGLRLCSVDEIMHRTDRLPLVPLDCEMSEVVVTMTSMGFGIAGVVDTIGRLAGVITDGDLRRHFAELLTATAEQVMTRSPKTLHYAMSAEEALNFMNENRITCAFVIDDNAPVNTNFPIGIVHIHDFLRIGLE
jgi:arabinose-5-phosphate isomerase